VLGRYLGSATDGVRDCRILCHLEMTSWFDCLVHVTRAACVITLPPKIGCPWGLGSPRPPACGELTWQCPQYWASVEAHELEAHRHSAPDPDGLETVAGLLGGTDVGEVRRLDGGVTCAVHRVEIRAPQGGNQVVVKRFPPGDGNPQAEWEALRFAEHTAALSPIPLAFDPDGRWFGTATLVMSCLPGSPVLTPGDNFRWTWQLAAALLDIHSTRAEVPIALRRAPIWERWTSEGLVDNERTVATKAAISRLGSLLWDSGFCHCDFHPGNVLFENGAVSGVVDWSAARAAPLLSDVGRCRAALAVWPGGDASDRFLSAYRSQSGTSLTGVAYWDLLSATIALQNARGWMPLYHNVDISLDTVRQRAEQFTDNALDRIRSGDDPD